MIPLIGCAAHLLNLAVQHILFQEVYPVYTDLLTKVKSFMIDLKSIKNRPKLAAVTQLAQQIRNNTKWDS